MGQDGCREVTLAMRVKEEWDCREEHRGREDSHEGEETEIINSMSVLGVKGKR